ncbi:hypothetical protein BDZ94DRAFT_1278112, partial [Collybia nuda]
TTTALGQALRRFANITCKVFDTKELPREEAARGRRKVAVAARKGKGKEKAPADSAGRKPKKKDGQLRKLFNLCTYKLHALGDYVKSIRLYGTTDNYSTQVGELEHRRVKRFYARTNKLRQFTRQIAKHQRCERILRNMRLRHEQGLQAQPIEPENTNTPIPPPIQAHTKHTASVPFEVSEPLANTPPSLHHHVSESTKQYENVTQWLTEHSDDPAMIDFLPRLKDHLLGRILGRLFDGDETPFSDDDRNTISFVNNKIYKHKVIRINYTTYDMRRSQDSINPRTHADIMVLSREDPNSRDSHPYWYARVVGIFHAQVRHVGPDSKSDEPQKMVFLWVRWFGRNLEYRAGWTARRLHCVGFVDGVDPQAFGFLDPSEVIRGVHMIPAFAHGHTSSLLGPSIARQVTENDEDWMFYYVGMFVDRDMFMRFRGGGIGHKAMWDALAKINEEFHGLFEEDEDDDPMI